MPDPVAAFGCAVWQESQCPVDVHPLGSRPGTRRGLEVRGIATQLRIGQRASDATAMSTASLAIAASLPAAEAAANFQAP